MAHSTLDPDAWTGRDRSVHRGHGTRALGPSDSSDSGSDLLGAPGLAQPGANLPLVTGTTSDPEESTAHYTAGPDVGDADLDSDTDSTGTGERKAAGRDTVVRDGADIDVDHVESFGRRRASYTPVEVDFDESPYDGDPEPEDSGEEESGPDATGQPERR